MNISLIIPAHNEQQFLNKTIDNFISTANEKIEVVAILNGYDQLVDERAIVIRNKENLGERLAMNQAAKIATGKYLMRIDGHCDISPPGWDIMMVEVLKLYPKGVVVPVLTALSPKWERLPGWYGFCKLLPSMEEKWVTKKNYKPIESNMAFTGCGFMIDREFYLSFGGADESLPEMGAIGPEFALRGWLEGGGVFTRTDVTLGHIFNTGGYNTNGVELARSKLLEKWGKQYNKLALKFPEYKEVSMDELKTNATNKRVIVIERKDEHVTTETSTGKPLKKTIELFKYIYEDDGKGPSEEEIRKQFAPKAYKVGEEIYYPDEKGNWLKVA